jgi:hypothetical protein
MARPAKRNKQSTHTHRQKQDTQNIAPTEVQTRQKPVGADPGFVSNRRSGEGATNGTYSLTLPLASRLCLPILRATGTWVPFSKLLEATTTTENFDPALVSLPIPTNTNQTFTARIQVAIEYLISNGLLNRTNKKFRRTGAGTDRVMVGFEGPWPDFVEARVKAKRTNPINLPVEARKAFFAINTDVARIVATFEKAEPHKLVGIYQNAQRILSEPDRGQSHLKARTVIDALTIEFDRRSTSASLEDRFKWPTTEASSGDGSLKIDKTHPEGMLAYLDYRVGANGEHSRARQAILSRVFESSLPPVFDKAYMDEWGQNGTASRLRKMAESIAAFARNAKRRDADRLDQAIRQWEQDLSFLHDRYYVGKFFFGWPSTTVESATPRVKP